MLPLPRARSRWWLVITKTAPDAVTARVQLQPGQPSRHRLADHSHPAAGTEQLHGQVLLPPPRGRGGQPQPLHPGAGRGRDGPPGDLAAGRGGGRGAGPQPVAESSGGAEDGE